MQDQRQRSLESPKRKRPKRDDVSQGEDKVDDIAALLLSLASTKSSLETKETYSLQDRLQHDAATAKEESQESHRVVSDDEDEHGNRRSAAKKKSSTPANIPTETAVQKKNDWRAFCRPIGPPPRLPMVPAGFVFPARAPGRK